MKNIAFVIDTIATDTAGTQKQLLETIRRLNRADFSPRLICLWESPWMRANTLPCPCTVLGYRGFLKPDFPAVIRRLAALIRSERLDLLQTFFEDSIFVAYLGAALSGSRPVLVSSRRDMGLGKGNQPWYHRLFALTLPWVNRRFAGIVANSRQVQEYVARRERTPAAKIKVIYNGVALPEPTSRPPPELFTKHSADVWIGLLASLTPIKRHDLLIRAFARLSESCPGVRVRMAFLGEGGEHERLERLAEQLGVRDRIHFEGAVKDVDGYLTHLDIGVLCSDREGLSNAILEYMAYGLPVVATSVGGNPELVSAENGVCVPPDDPEALAAALRSLVEDTQTRARLGVASKEKARRLFSWGRSIADLESYYRELVSAPKRAG